ncbi:hypothetical protein P030_05045 [Anaplasma phagocytophilum str. CRT35]|nr:hypothetical protein P030_05045 [Anaplasma phagocytophilum str. CRT35]
MGSYVAFISYEIASSSLRLKAVENPVRRMVCGRFFICCLCIEAIFTRTAFLQCIKVILSVLREAIPKFRNTVATEVITLISITISRSLSTCYAVFMFAHAKTHRYGNE